MEFNFILFKSYESYEIKFFTKISSFTVSSFLPLFLKRIQGTVRKPKNYGYVHNRA